MAPSRREMQSWGPEESNRLLRLKSQYANLSWGDFHELNLFPGRSTSAVQVQYSRLRHGRRSQKSGSRANATDPAKRSAPSSRLRAIRRPRNYPILIDDDDESSEEEGDICPNAAAAPVHQPPLPAQGQATHSEISPTTTPFVSPSETQQVATDPTSQVPRIPGSGPVDPEDTTTPLRQTPTATTAFGSNTEPSSVSVFALPADKLRRIHTTTASLPQAGAASQPLPPGTASNTSSTGIAQHPALAVNAAPPTPAPTPRGTELVQQYPPVFGLSAQPVGISKPAQAETELAPTTTPTPTQEPQPASSAQQGLLNAACDSAPSTSLADQYLNGAARYLALYSEAFENTHAAEIRQLKAEKLSVLTELQDLRSLFDNVVAERDRLKAELLAQSESFTRQVEEMAESKKKMQDDKKKMQEDIQKITGVCKTIEEFENLRVLDLFGFRPKN